MVWQEHDEMFVRDTAESTVDSIYFFHERTVWMGYRKLDATPDAPAAFELCVRHEQGAWAVYDSRHGGVTDTGNAGSTDRTCAGRFSA